MYPKSIVPAVVRLRIWAFKHSIKYYFEDLPRVFLPGIRLQLLGKVVNIPLG